MSINPGEFVIANAGNDKGKCYIVLSVDNQFLYLCNGKNRKLNCLKKKKAIHVLPVGAYDEAIVASIADGSVTDRQIRRSISAYKGNIKAESIIIKK